jgi:hypothetical protein
MDLFSQNNCNQKGRRVITVKRLLGLTVYFALAIFFFASCHTKIQEEATYIAKNDSLFSFGAGKKWELSSSGIQPNGDIFFKICRFTPFVEDSIRYDTIFVNKNGFSFSDTVKHIQFSLLYIKNCINTNQISKFFNLKGIDYQNIREKIFWFCKLSNSTLFEEINNYGDTIGFYVKSQDGGLVPEDYYYLKKSHGYYGGGQEGETIFKPKSIIVGEKKYKGNYIRVEMNLVHKDYFPQYRKEHAGELKNYNTKLRSKRVRTDFSTWGNDYPPVSMLCIDDLGSEFELNKDFLLILEISLNSEIYFHSIKDYDYPIEYGIWSKISELSK